MELKTVRLSPSILSADFARLAEQIAEVERTGAVDRIHVDVMDGHFVPNITIGPLVVQAIRPRTSLLLEVHLMIESPGRYIGAFVEAGADLVVVHQETCPHLHKDVDEIKRRGARAGVALNPATPLSSVEEALDYLDQVLIMTVNPGFGGQSFIEGVLPKVRRLHDRVRERDLRDLEIGVDGGVNASNAAKVAQAGGQVLVAGSAIFGHPRGIEYAIRELYASIGA